MKNPGNSEIHLRDLLRVVFRYKLMIFIVLIIVVGIVYIGVELRTQTYQSSVRILVTGTMQKDVEVQRSLGPGKLINTQMMLVKSKPVIERAVRALELHHRPIDYEKEFATRLKAALIERRTRKLKVELEQMNPDQREASRFFGAMSGLYGKIITSPVGETSMFDIVVRDYSPSESLRIANAVSRSYVIFDLEQQIAELHLTYGKKNVTIRKLEKHIENLKKTLDGTRLPDAEAIGPASVKIISQAGPGTPVAMTPSKR